MWTHVERFTHVAEIVNPSINKCATNMWLVLVNLHIGLCFKSEGNSLKLYDRICVKVKYNSLWSFSN